MLLFDLQLFSEEKTEQPTSKKIRDSRQKGQVAQSKDLNGVLALLAVFAALAVLGQYYATSFFGFFHYTLAQTEGIDAFYQDGNIHKYMTQVCLLILKLSLPTLLVAMVIGVLVSYMQVGFLFTTETLKPKLEKINPLKGAKNLFSTRSLVELAKSLAKATLIVFASYDYLKDRLIELLVAMELDIGQIIAVMWDLVVGVVVRSALILLVIAVFDYAYKRWKNNKDMMMTKQEIKDEYKQSEGDPMLKSKIKEKQRAMAMSRMMQDVPTADVVITNPTHYAVAVKYDPQTGDAPKVVAKGQDLIAQNIKKIAGEAEVPIVENKPLARALYASSEVGDFIPIELYEAVAEVLAYVYTLKKDA